MQHRYNILLIDDEVKVISALKRLFVDDEFNVFSTTIPKEALNMLKKDRIDVIICDQNMPYMSGIEVLKQSKEISPDTIRILITGYSDISTAISAINEGSVYYYFSKPWSNEEVVDIVNGAIIHKLKQKGKKHISDALLDKLNNRVKSIEDTEEINTDNIISRTNINKFPVMDDDKIVLLDIGEIFYLMAEKGSIYAKAQRGKFRCSKNLEEYEQSLKTLNFFRCHKSYLVNLDKVNEISPWFNGALNLGFKGIEDTISVSRNYAGKLKTQYGL